MVTKEERATVSEGEGGGGCERSWSIGGGWSQRGAFGVRKVGATRNDDSIREPNGIARRTATCAR